MSLDGVRSLLLPDADIQSRVQDLAARIEPAIDDETVCVCLLTGGLWFAADLTRALSRLGRNPLFDALWMTSYGDARTSSGQALIRAGLQRSVKDKQVLLIDDVLDSGLSLATAKELMLELGARDVLVAVFAEKPWPTKRDFTADFVAWNAPDRFLIGYGMDASGRYRGLPDIEAVD